MTAENKAKYDAKLKRINDAIALREPDRVPITPSAGLYPIYRAGYTVAEVIYDTSLEKMGKAVKQYLREYDPDIGVAAGGVYAGEGPAMELMQPKNMRWAGMPGNIIDDNSLQQYIEFPTLLDDEFEEFFSDRTGWKLRKSLFRTSGLLEPLSTLEPTTFMGSARQIAAQFSTPAFREMIEKLWKVDELYKDYQQRANALHREVEDMGYPLITGAMAEVPFDAYSDNYRGTLLSLSDLYINTEYVEKFIEEQFERTIAQIRASKGVNPGKHVFMPLHKGMDGFMGDEQYRNYYWRHLQKIIEEIIDSGHVPHIYTEGKYNSRLDCLAEVPKGKVFYHFEEVDMAEAKKKLGDVACIAGGFRATLLEWGTKQEVIDECKRLLDICAPGGGFVFETSCGLGNCKPENVEAMFDTVREYGSYK